MELDLVTRRRSAVLSALGIAFGLLVWLGVGAEPAEAKVFLTRLEALKLAFPDCEVDRKTHYLTDEQKQGAEKAAGVELSSALAYSYRATCGGSFAGTAYFDSHLVRTLPETIMIVVDPDNKITRIEIVEFSEPEDYIPMDRWYAQFHGKGLDRELQLKRSIRGVTGATLTARATTDAARRVLALHQVLNQALAETENVPKEEPSVDKEADGSGETP